MKISDLDGDKIKELQRSIMQSAVNDSRTKSGVNSKFIQLQGLKSVIFYLRERNVSYANIAKAINRVCEDQDIELAFIVKPHHVKKILDLSGNQISERTQIKDP